MKFLSYNFRRGSVGENNYLGKYLEKHGFERIFERPVDPYLIVAHTTGNNFNWFPLGTDHLDKNILRDLKNGKAGLILNSDCHTFSLNKTFQRDINPPIIKYIKKTAEVFQIEPENIVYIDQNFKVENVLKKSNLTGFWFNPWEHHIKFYGDVSKLKNDIKNKISREKKFLYLGGKAREFRLRFLFDLLKIKNFKDEAYYSTASGNFLETDTKTPRHMPEQILDIINVGDSQDQDGVYISHYHTNSYFNIVPMSYFYTNHSQLEINEKLFKPIAAMQPFIILGEPGTLRALKTIGYKTFNEFIDESYDDELDDAKRYKKILLEINKLASLNDQQLKEMLYDMFHILDHNFNTLTDKFNGHNYDLANKIKQKFVHIT
jgi:hypothetical protein